MEAQSVKLLDFDTLTETDLSEMMDREIPCEFGQRATHRKDGSPPKWCTDVATHWVRLSCRRCGHGGWLLTCQPCTKFLRGGLRLVGLVIIPWLSHAGCRRPGIFKITSGSL